MSDCVLLIGQAPGRGDGDPLEGRVGKRIARFSQLTEEEYLERTERTNLLKYFPGGHRGKGHRFPLSKARPAARRMTGEMRDRDVILIGKGVARAFGVHGKTGFTWHPGLLGTRKLAWIQHPSGVNHWWNSDENKERAGRFLRSALGDGTEVGAG